MASKQPTRQAEDGGERAKLWSMIKDIRIAMMTTMDADGTLRSRPMANVQTGQKAFDGVLWFFTRASAHKNLEIAEHNQVNLAYADPDEQHYVSVSGRASLVRDGNKVKQLWSEPLRTWFPNGADDPDLALIRIEVESAEYWDSPSGTMVYLYGYIKSQLTGAPPSPGENRKLAF